MLETSDSSISVSSMWSSDAYYYDPQDFNTDNAQVEEVDLPLEYNPVWRMPDPWFTSSQCKEDFILVSEFSELEGPKPLITIPSQVVGSFDLNDFAVRIMTVDCQSHPSDSFKIHEDTSIILSEGKYGVYAYVHYFTLYDSKARGFVRPFCMAFVTSCMSKLDLFYDDIHKEFASVCWKMRQGNLMVFVKDMTYHLTDLQYTKEKFIESEHQKEQESDFGEQTTGLPNLLDLMPQEDVIILKSLSLDSLNSAIKEVRHILQTVNTMIASLDLTPEESEEYGVLVSSYHSSHGRILDSRSNSIADTNESTTPKPRFSPCVSNSIQYSSSLNETSPIRDIAARRSSSVRRSGSFSQLSGLYEDTITTIYEPKLVRTTNKRRYDKTLRTLHELCLASAKRGLNRLRYVQKYFAKSLVTLKLEKREAEILLPNEGLLTMGRIVQMNFLPQEICTVKPSKSATFSDVFSDDGASFASAESFLSCDDLSPTKPGGIVLSSSLEDLNWSRRNSGEVPYLNTSSSISDSINSLGSSINPDNGSVRGFCSEHSDNTSDVESSANAQNCDIRMANVTALSASDLTRSTDEVTDCQCEGPFKVFSLPDQLYSLGKNSPGYGLLKLMQRYTFASHLMFSLLCGRPVIIMAPKKKEPDIRAVITALSFLVPGYGRISSQHQIDVNPLTVADLNHKLLGLITSPKIAREKQVPKEVEVMCTLFDIERKMLYGPCYQGGLLTEVYNKRKTHIADSSYLVQIHSHIQEFSLKAYVFYHTFIVNVSGKLPDMYTNPDEAKLAYEKAEEHFLSHMKMSLHDTIIVKNLAEWIHTQVDDSQKLQCSNSFKNEFSSQKLRNLPKLNNMSSQLFKM